MKKQFFLTVLFLAWGGVSLWLPQTTRAAVFPIATNPATASASGGLAYDGTNFLAGLVTGTNVTGQLFSPTGALLGAPVTVGANPGFPAAAAFAFGRTNYLAVWSDLSLSSGITMFGQVLTPGGVKVGSAFPLLAAAGSYGVQNVRGLAFDGTNFLAVWQDSNTRAYYGQRLTPAGTLLGGPLLLSNQAHNGHDASVAFGKTSYLVAWQSDLNQNGTNHTYAALVSPAGTVTGPLQISQQSSADRNPLTVGTDGTNFLVVWNHADTLDTNGAPVWDLHARVVAANGTMPAPEQAVVADEGNQVMPALAFDGVNYLLTWSDYSSSYFLKDSTIRGRFLDAAGSAIGPEITAFTPQDTNVFLFGFNGVRYGGGQFALVATMGTLQFDNSGNLTGFPSGTVYGRFAPNSQTTPMFTNATISGGFFGGQLAGVPGMTYTVELSTNLVTWTPAGLVEATNRFTPIQDQEPIAGHSRLFYRLAVGNTLPFSTGLAIHEFVNAGNFAAATTPAISYPVSLAGYSAVMGVENDPAPAPATNVFFTGPAGSGLTATAADPQNSNINPFDANYQSPFISSPAAAPGGNWTVSYKGTNQTFNLPDPQAPAHLTIPVPTVTVSGDTLQSVSWVYKDAATGTTLNGAPAYVTGLQVEIDNATQGRIYESPVLAPGVSSHGLTANVIWSAVSSVNLAYDDALGNRYIIHFTKP